MKRKPIIPAIALLLVVGAALWGVNYRLDHSPLTQADKEFRALVAGADSAVIAYYSSIGSKAVRVTLNSAQVRHLLEQLRFSKDMSSSGATLGRNGYYHFRFLRQGKALLFCEFWQNTGGSKLYQVEPRSSNAGFEIFKVNPRFEKRLNRALDAYLRQRNRP